MPTFESHDATMMPKKTYKNQGSRETKDAKDAKDAKTKTYVLSNDAYLNLKMKNLENMRDKRCQKLNMSHPSCYPVLDLKMLKLCSNYIPTKAS